LIVSIRGAQPRTRKATVTTFAATWALLTSCRTNAQEHSEGSHHGFSDATRWAGIFKSPACAKSDGEHLCVRESPLTINLARVRLATCRISLPASPIVIDFVAGLAAIFLKRELLQPGRWDRGCMATIRCARSNWFRLVRLRARRRSPEHLRCCSISSASKTALEAPCHPRKSEAFGIESDASERSVSWNANATISESSSGRSRQESSRRYT